MPSPHSICRRHTMTEYYIKTSAYCLNIYLRKEDGFLFYYFNPTTVMHQEQQQDRNVGCTLDQCNGVIIEDSVISLSDAFLLSLGIITVVCTNRALGSSPRGLNQLNIYSR